ncbi:unnamed protein product [Cylindrotheca closterium]|uniref:SCP domain-containing protein n=1 Tax=Cylindrotheca closterium TaxID=2856 RepID=A0AAD2CHG1_9STRA|nr:unnamed protein product [Cylindrotheca closterium]
MKVLATLNLLVLALRVGSFIVEAHDVRGDERSNNLRTRTETARTISHHHEARNNEPEARGWYEDMYESKGLKCTDVPYWAGQDGYTCKEYEGTKRCSFPEMKGSYGKTHMEACCLCGGGTKEKLPTPEGKLCTDVKDWKDPSGSGCSKYDVLSCTGNMKAVGSYGLAPHQACCVCEGYAESVDLLNDLNDLNKLTSPTTSPPSAAPCVDDPDWKSTSGRGCSSYSDSLECKTYDSFGMDQRGPIGDVCCESCKKKPNYNVVLPFDMKPPEAMRAGHHKRSRTSDENPAARGYENVEGRSCVDYDGWKETNYGSNCTWYDPKTNTDACTEYASDVGTDNKNVTEACCVCGGGSTGGSVSNSTANAAHPVAVTASTVAPGAAGGDAAKWVEAHNKRRKKYSKEWGYEYKAVGWNEDLAAQAQAWADHLIAKECGNIPHLTKKCRTEGENNAQEQSDPRPPVKNIDGVLTAWTEEEIAGDPAMADHASQVLWKDTTAIGCGYATGTCSDGWETAVQVCRYFPSGNLNCGGPCIDAVKKNIMQVDNTKPMKSTSDMHKCLKKQEQTYGK